MSDSSPAITQSTQSYTPGFLHHLRAIVSIMCLVIWCVFMLLMLSVLKLCKVSNLDRFYFTFHGGCCWLLNLRCRISGEVSTIKPTLFLSNHISYLDVFVLGRCVPAYFIAKSEVAGWPVLGWLAKAQNTLFFERNSKKVRHQMDVMAQHFDRKGNLILFPEGTSTNGEEVKFFKSSLLQAVESAEHGVMIQPVTVVYTRLQGRRMGRDDLDRYAWYDTMPFASHFLNMFGMPAANVEVVFHAPVRLRDFTDRKACAQYCQQQVTTGLVDALASA